MSSLEEDAKKRSGIPANAFANAEEQLRERTDRFRQVYANNMRVNMSTWDLGITFGEIIGDRDGQPIIEETVRVLMTKEIAKVLQMILKGHIEAFEAQYGEIKIPIAPESAVEVPGEPEPESPTA